MNSSWKRALLALLLLAASQSTFAWNRGGVATFATLPAGVKNPEGIAVDSVGRLYVTTFAVGGTPSGLGQLLIFGRHGQLLRQLDVAGSSTLLLGVDFNPANGKLLVLDFGKQQVLDVNPATGATSLFASLGAGAGPNALTFDESANVYISDSAQGIIWRTGPGGGGLIKWVESDLLKTTGVPPFGANGLAFNNDRSAMFVANTGNDSVVRIPVRSGTPGTPEVFVNSVNGADGLIIDEDDNLWVAANQSDEIVVINPSGRVIAKLGDFNGIGAKGSPKGLLFPASLVRYRDSIYVTNLALDLRLFGLAQPVDAQWAADAKFHTISKIRARIPTASGLPGRTHDDEDDD